MAGVNSGQSCGAVIPGTRGAQGMLNQGPMNRSGRIRPDDDVLQTVRDIYVDDIQNTLQTLAARTSDLMVRL